MELYNANKKKVEICRHLNGNRVRRLKYKRNKERTDDDKKKT